MSKITLAQEEKISWINFHTIKNFKINFKLTMEVLGFEQTYMYEILVTEPLRTSECADECHCRSHTYYRYINYKCK